MNAQFTEPIKIMYYGYADNDFESWVAIDTFFYVVIYTADLIKI